MRTLVLGGALAQSEVSTPLKESLEPMGIFVKALPDSGEPFLSKLARIRPDLVLMDSGFFKACSAEESVPFKWLVKLKTQEGLQSTGLVLMGEPPVDETFQLDMWLNAGLEEVLPETGTTATLQERIRLLLNHKNKAWQLEEMNDQLASQNQELYDRNLQVEKELYTTRQLQQSLLPPQINEADEAIPLTNDTNALGKPRLHFKNDRLKITGVYMPCDALGGDLYDIIPFPDESVGVTLADVSGHGVPAGFVTTLFKSSFYRATNQHKEPDQVLFQVNNELADIVKTGEYVTALYMRIKENGRFLEFSGAGHPYPIWYHAATQSISRIEENGTPLVWIPGIDYPLAELPLEAGDKLLMFTDGISEMRNPEGDILGEEEMEVWLLQLIEKGSKKILHDLMLKSSDFAQGEPMGDDLSMVLVEIY
jgi:serine phosphatase RsbU (regulator of sigma subunit)